MIEWSLLRAAYDRYDPVPAEVLATARRAGDLVGPVATLPAVGGLRGEQVLRFAGAAGRLTVEVEPTRLSGVADALGGALWVRWPAAERLVVPDGGWFTVDGLPRGPLSFAVRRAGSPDAVTPWFVA